MVNNMVNAERQRIEKIEENFAEELFFQIRDKSFEAVRRIAEGVEIGMLEEEANEMAIALLKKPTFSRCSPSKSS